jgi:tetratricopeptide (TPR) repeat protein
MYPYLTPFGIIMKINRDQLQKLPGEVFRRDHEFWSKYSERLTGNWITYDTSIKQIADFIEKVHMKRNFSDFKGDRRFIRDQEAQKAFSKLRTAIAGIYAWRLDHPTQFEGLAEQEALLKEADFAFRQAFAFCPYSPEVVFRYAPLLAKLGRIDDAILVTETGLKMDPNNGSVEALLKQLTDFKKNSTQAQAALLQMQKEVETNPNNFQAAFSLASSYMQSQQVAKASDVLDRVLTNTNANVQVLSAVADAFLQMRDYPRLENAYQKLTEKDPAEPKYWYYLATVEMFQGKHSEAMTNLTRSIDVNKRQLQTNPAALNVQINLLSDHNFDPLRALPEFQQLVTPAGTNK